MAGKHAIEPFLVEHVDRGSEPVQEIGGWRVGEEPLRIRGCHACPRPVRLGQTRRFRSIERLGTHCVERQAGWQHQPFLRAGDSHIDAPLVMAVVDRGERRDGVNEQECRVPRSVDGAAHLVNGRRGAGRGLVVDHAHGLDFPAAVLAQPRFDRIGVGTATPVRCDKLGYQAEGLGHGLPQTCEMAGLVHQHLVAGRKRIDQACLPRPGTRGRIQEDRTCGPEDRLDAAQHALAQLLKLGPAVI